MTVKLDYARLEVRVATWGLNREQCVRLLESASIQCYDHEPLDVLREAVVVNVEDGTISKTALLESLR